ncbi:hypothetical protein AB0K15_02255 [Amycolatopsis sp. NPDC049253]|uniref:hypothetical protein n=1 Tax=Amycolatopsis sp. NPDC049253 TaxID=3155274 RepID=UPI0034209F04
MLPGVSERRTHDCVRYGTTSLFAALDIATGQVIGQHQRCHRHQEFRRFPKTIDKNTPAELDLHLVCDSCENDRVPPRVWFAPCDNRPRCLAVDMATMIQGGACCL